MAAYLLSYDQKDWGESELTKFIDAYKSGNKRHRWKIKTDKARAGDRIFLMKRGKGSRGLFGSGYIDSDRPYKEIDFNGKLSRFVMVAFDYLSHPSEKIIIDRSTLLRSFFENHWDAQGSGNTINPSIISGLETMWLEITGGAEITYPDEAGMDEKFFEGGKKKVFVNRYERNLEAKQKCIEHWGTSCCICGFHFQSFYGELGNNYIHVHHLKALASIGEEYEVDPINDLRPVCPNCHAMLHTKETKTKEELELLVDRYGFLARYEKV